MTYIEGSRTYDKGTALIFLSQRKLIDAFNDLNTGVLVNVDGVFVCIAENAGALE